MEIPEAVVARVTNAEVLRIGAEQAAKWKDTMDVLGLGPVCGDPECERCGKRR